MRKFSEQYARTSGTYFCMDKVWRSAGAGPKLALAHA